MLDEFIRGPGLPFHFWSVVLFVVGAIVGSFLNVCIYRMPRGESLVRPGSHCPACQRPIPLRLNIPLVSWLWLRGRCAFCQAAISIRYWVVELATALLFLWCWLAFGRNSPDLAVVNCILAAGLLVATCIDFEHYIIPDALTLGGVGVGLVASFVVPGLHQAGTPAAALRSSLLGAAFGGGIIYAALRLGKLLFGRHRIRLAAGSRVVFGEFDLVLPDRVIPYDELFYRKTDWIRFEAQQVELPDRCYWNAGVRMDRSRLVVGEATWVTEEVPGFEAVTDLVTLPREALGLGDVKFMAAIGAFLGWRGVLFSLFGSAVVGAVVGTSLILLRGRDRSRPIPYGPYLAWAAMTWVMAQDYLAPLVRWWLGR